MKRLSICLAGLLVGIMLMGADGCSSDPNVEGAKLDLKNKDYDRALENLNTALEKDSANAEAWVMKGSVLQEKAFSDAGKEAEAHSGMLDEMMGAYNTAMRLNPEKQEEVNNQLRLAFFNEFQRGVQAFNRGQDNEEEFNTAADYFGNAAMIQPDSSGAYVNQGYALLSAGRQAEAIEPFETAMEKGEKEPETYLYLARLYMSNDRAADAVTLLEEARNTFEGNEQIQAELLNAYQAANQMDRAMEVYGEAVTNEPENKLYRYNYGSLLLESGKYDEAIEHLSKAVELDPEYSSAQYNLGAAYINQAVDVNEKVTALDDEIRAAGSSLSDADKSAKEADMDQLSEQRRVLFEKAIVPLEKAHSLTQAEGGEEMPICRALFQAYVQTGQQDRAKGVSDCAGYDDVNN